MTTHNTNNRQTSMPTAGFEPTISAGERQQTYALERADTGTRPSGTCNKVRNIWIYRQHVKKYIFRQRKSILQSQKIKIRFDSKNVLLKFGLEFNYTFFSDTKWKAVEVQPTLSVTEIMSHPADPAACRYPPE
jgi:hypothetical protein